MRPPLRSFIHSRGVSLQSPNARLCTQCWTHGSDQRQTLILPVEPVLTPGKHQGQSPRWSRACPGLSASSGGDGAPEGPAGRRSCSARRGDGAPASLEEAEVTLSFSLFLSLPCLPPRCLGQNHFLAQRKPGFLVQ